MTNASAYPQRQAGKEYAELKPIPKVGIVSLVARLGRKLPGRRSVEAATPIVSRATRGVRQKKARVRGRVSREGRASIGGRYLLREDIAHRGGAITQEEEEARAEEEQRWRRAIGGRPNPFKDEAETTSKRGEGAGGTGRTCILAYACSAREPLRLRWCSVKERRNLSAPGHHQRRDRQADSRGHNVRVGVLANGRGVQQKRLAKEIAL